MLKQKVFEETCKDTDYNVILPNWPIFFGLTDLGGRNKKKGGGADFFSLAIKPLGSGGKNQKRGGGTLRYFLENQAYTNPKIPSKLFEPKY